MRNLAYVVVRSEKRRRIVSAHSSYCFSSLVVLSQGIHRIESLEEIIYVQIGNGIAFSLTTYWYYQEYSLSLHEETNLQTQI